MTGMLMDIQAGNVGAATDSLMKLPLEEYSTE